MTEMPFWKLIATDVRAKAEWLYGGADSTELIKACCTDGTFAMVCYRLMQAAQRAGLTPLAMVFNKLNVIFGGCVIGRGAHFGPAFVLIHSQGVVINAAVRGGERVMIEHQVTIGAERGGSPVLGDRVFLGAGARVIGAIRVGSDVKVGANAVVIADVSDGCTMVGVPAHAVG